MDWEGIPPTAAWFNKIKTAIEGARAFVFVLSPDSVASKVCREELSHAVAHHKRLISLISREIDADKVPPELSRLNWIFLRDQDDFERSVDQLLQAVDTDLDWVDSHTALLQKAVEWEQKGRDSSILLRGPELAKAEAWQIKTAEKEPKPTEIMAEFIQASRQGRKRLQRRILGAVSFGLALAVILGFIAVVQYWEALWQFLEANRRGKIALSRELAAQVNNLADSHLDRALLLVAEAAQVVPTLEARSALLNLLQKYPHFSIFLRGHNKSVSSMAFSSDGRTLASGCGDKTINFLGYRNKDSIGTAIVWAYRVGKQRGLQSRRPYTGFWER